jgi:hypothetical protein
LPYIKIAATISSIQHFIMMFYYIGPVAEATSTSRQLDRGMTPKSRPQSGYSWSPGLYQTPVLQRHRQEIVQSLYLSLRRRLAQR